MQILKSKQHKTQAKTAEKAVSDNLSFRKNLNVRTVIKYPAQNERAQALAASNKYVFFVDASANKNLIKQDVENRYGVGVSAVNIVNLRGKSKKWRNLVINGSDRKKAIVTLKPGEKLEID
jgi:large subunit ribosomal protein L23